MAKLTAAERKKLPKKAFALPGGRYPIDTENRGRNALARASANASPAEQATIRRKVHAKYPDIEIGNHGSHVPARGEDHRMSDRKKG